MGVYTSGETVCFVGVEVDPKSFFQAVGRVELEGLPLHPLSLLDTCARWMAVELERDPFSLNLTRWAVQGGAVGEQGGLGKHQQLPADHHNK